MVDERDKIKLYKKCCDVLDILQSIRGGKVYPIETLEGEEYERVWTGESNIEALCFITLSLHWSIWATEGASFEIVCNPIIDGDFELLAKALAPLLLPAELNYLLSKLCKEAFLEYIPEDNKAFTGGFSTAEAIACQINDTIELVTRVYREKFQEHIRSMENRR